MRNCNCHCDEHSLSPELEFASYDRAAEEAFVVLMPGRRSGAPTIGHSRIPTDMVADFYWNGGLEDLRSGYDLTVGQVVVAVWYEARYGTRMRRKRWADWLAANEDKLWSPNFYGRPDLPPCAVTEETDTP